jgi:4-hydroxy-3-polyprenylbenzoate decarboxylase
VKRVIVGISGASGPHYGVRLVEVLREHTDVEVHLVLSKGARATITYEMGRDPDEVVALAHVVHDEANLAASIASGTFVTGGMVIAPCSVKTLGAIANGFGHNLVCRAADVTLKERRRLVLAVRETPLHSIHLRNMLTLSDMGVTIFPPTPAFYNKPETIDEIVDQTALRILDQFGLDLPSPVRWAGLPAGEDDE